MQALLATPARKLGAGITTTVAVMTAPRPLLVAADLRLQLDAATKRQSLPGPALSHASFGLPEPTNCLNLTVTVNKVVSEQPVQAVPSSPTFAPEMRSRASEKDHIFEAPAKQSTSMDDASVFGAPATSTAKHMEPVVEIPVGPARPPSRNAQATSSIPLRGGRRVAAAKEAVPPVPALPGRVTRRSPNALTENKVPEQTQSLPVKRATRAVAASTSQVGTGSLPKTTARSRAMPSLAETARPPRRVAKAATSTATNPAPTASLRTTRSRTAAADSPATSTRAKTAESASATKVDKENHVLAQKRSCTNLRQKA